MNQNFYLIRQEKLRESRWYRNIYRALALYSVLAVLFIALLILAQDWHTIVLALLAFILARFIISPIIYLIYKKARPYQKFKFTTFYSVLFSRPTVKSNAFPSDHAISFASIGTVVYNFWPHTGLVIFALALLNGWARVVLGYHDLWDILAGWILGVVMAIIVVAFIGPLIFTR